MCLCHGSLYDVSGRVRRGPAKTNLAVVRHDRNGNRIVLLG
jgi:ubiquinol-cytochrome c reductase iron-sulfur subunit